MQGPINIRILIKEQYYGLRDNITSMFVIVSHTIGIKYHTLLPTGFSRWDIRSCKKFQTFSIK